MYCKAFSAGRGQQSLVAGDEIHHPCKAVGAPFHCRGQLQGVRGAQLILRNQLKRSLSHCCGRLDFSPHGSQQC